MRIDSIRLKNFRCFSDKSLYFSPQINVILGPNASGKTSIVEAINYFGIGKSFRTTDDNSLVKTKENNFFISGNIVSKEYTDFYSVFFQNGKKKIKKNDVNFKKTSDFIGHVLVVLFSSIDFCLIDGTPQNRRDFLDRTICQISNVYLEAISNYQKTLKARNALLKRLNFDFKPNDSVLLETISVQLAIEGKKIIDFRRRVIQKLNTVMKPINYDIADSYEEIQIDYHPNSVEEELEDALKKDIRSEIERGTTLFGPHRDDFLFLLNHKEASNFASRGQIRDLILSLKLTIAQVIFEIKKEHPILLLDDVFSELDKYRQNKLVKFLKGDVQIIITAPSISDVEKKWVEQANIIQVKER